MTPKTLILVPIIAMGAVFFAVIGILPYFKIFPRLGYGKWFALLMLVPLANLIFLYIVAFSTPSSPSDATANRS
jgi:hypothetical protein